ncbi:hypothetical protein [Flavobacterium sp. NKUCC04_CG]|uniref:hypothetical protein n=1 Tax=Flavobacterium sp. NKUCC04_CG TaxID=2842121 RepID=UPI001C5B1BD8|nr:hypothetical protein [Flavobacterium sp. NKUCC04_CG]MBW3519490.1 hypothetical protein [Flavobacterium sp. NKUCC04_CG]
MNLVLSNTPQYIQTVDFVRMQDWGWTSPVNELPKFSYTKGDRLPEVIPYQIYVRDIYMNSLLLGYSNLTLKATVIYETATQNWIILPQEIRERAINSSAVILDLALQPIVFSDLATGYHRAYIKFSIFATKSDVEEELTTYNFPVEFRVFDEGHFFYPHEFVLIKSPYQINFQNFFIKGNQWKVIVPKGIRVGNFNGEIIGLENGGTMIQGSGIAEFFFSLDYDTIMDILNQSPDLIMGIQVLYTHREYTIPVRIILSGDVYPNQLFFSVANGFTDGEKRVYINHQGTYSITRPSWLKIIKVSGSQRSILVSVISPDSFGTGVYQGDIKLRFTDKTISIPVTLNAYDGFNLGLKNDEIVFSKSMVPFEFYTDRTDTHIRLSLLLEGDATKSFRFEYEIPFFKKKAIYDISSMLSRMMMFDDFQMASYQKRSLNFLYLTVQEIKQGLPIREYRTSGIPIMKGLKPAIFSGQAILQGKGILSRFTKYGIGVVNVISKGGAFSYFIRKNNDIVREVEQENAAIATIYIHFKDFEVQPGDLIEFVLQAGTTTLEKVFSIVPDKGRSTMIFYENEYGLTSSIEMTGEVRIEREMSKRNEKNSVQDFLFTRSFNTAYEEKLWINTGYLFADQQVEIAELNAAVHAWFYQENERVDMVPVSKKQVKVDTEDFLLDYDLEFIINRKNHAQDYYF